MAPEGGDSHSLPASPVTKPGGSQAARRAASPQPICTRAELVLGVAFVGLLTLIFFAPLLSGKTLSNVPSVQQLSAPWLPHGKPLFFYPQGDQGAFYYPSTVFQTHAWRGGTIPFWNPFNLGGLPFLANGQSGVFYPLRIVLALLVAPTLNHDLFLVFHLFGTGIAMFLLMKEFQLRLPAALLGAAAWMFASWNSGFFQLEVMLPLACWLPVALLLIHRGSRTRSWRTATAAGVPLGLMALGGQLEVVALAVGICGAYSAALALAPALQRRATPRVDPRRLVHPILTLGVGGGIAAVTLVTTFLNANTGGREAPPYAAFASTHTLPIQEFAHVVSGGPPIPPTLVFSGTFVGVVPLVLAFVGLVRRRPGAALGRWLAIGTFLFAIGAPVVTWLAYHLVPGVSRLSSTGYALWAFDFGVVILAAIGLDGILKWSVTLARRLGGRRSALSASDWGLTQPDAAGVRRPLPPTGRRTHRADQTHAGRQRAAVNAVAALLAVTVVVATSWQLISYARYINPTFSDRREGSLFPTTPAIQALQSDSKRRSAAEPQRLIGFNAIAADESLVFPLEDSDGYDSVVASRVRVLWEVVSGYSVSSALAEQHREALLGFQSGRSASFVTVFQSATTRFDLLSRLGVTTIIVSPREAKPLVTRAAAELPSGLKPLYVGPDASVLNLAGTQPRAWVVHEADVASSSATALSRFLDPTFDYRTRMVVESDQGLGAPGRVQTRGSGIGVTANRTSLAANRSRFTVNSQRAGWLVMADMYAPGWQVTVNGRDAKLLRADYTLRAVPIPAGRSSILLRYRPPGFVLGVATTGVTVVGLLGVATLTLSARARRRRPQSRRRSAAMSGRG